MYGGMPFVYHDTVLYNRDIYCSKAFLPILYVKRDLITLIKRLESGWIDPWMMNKHIRPILLLNEAKAFVVIKPLNHSISYSDIPLSNISLFQT